MTDTIIITVKQVGRHIAEIDRVVAQWSFPSFTDKDGLFDFGWVGSFTQLATPDTTKVNTYQLYIERVAGP